MFSDSIGMMQNTDRIPHLLSTMDLPYPYCSSDMFGVANRHHPTTTNRISFHLFLAEKQQITLLSFYPLRDLLKTTLPSRIRFQEWETIDKLVTNVPSNHVETNGVEKKGSVGNSEKRTLHPNTTPTHSP